MLLLLFSLSATVFCRTVDYAERSFALGIQWILVRVIGTIPAPVLFGWMFDVSCIRYNLDACSGQVGYFFFFFLKNEVCSNFSIFKLCIYEC